MGTVLRGGGSRVYPSPQATAGLLVEVVVVGDQRLRLRFEDGVEGVIDLTAIVPFKGVFAPLRDPTVFAAARVHAELGTVCWPNGADLDPEAAGSEGSRTTPAVSVSDDGRGIRPGEESTGFGLRQMRERVEAMGGRLHVEAREFGTSVTVEVPAATTPPAS